MRKTEYELHELKKSVKKLRKENEKQQIQIESLYNATEHLVAVCDIQRKILNVILEKLCNHEQDFDEIAESLHTLYVQDDDILSFLKAEIDATDKNVDLLATSLGLQIILSNLENECNEDCESCECNCEKEAENKEDKPKDEKKSDIPKEDKNTGSESKDTKKAETIKKVVAKAKDTQKKESKKNEK